MYRIISYCKLKLLIFTDFLLNGGYNLDLEQPSQDNLQYLLERLGDKLGVANKVLLDEKDYDLDKYEDIKFLYDHVSKKGNLSPSETHAFIDELRAVRKN